MDRRRFAPSPEGLEDRDLLSVFGITHHRVSPVTGLDSNVAPLKSLRIDKLPYYLARIQPGRMVPTEIVTNLQNDLKSIESKLHAPPRDVLQAFNASLRAPLSHAGLQQGDVLELSDKFGKVLTASGADAATVATFQGHMLDLAKVDAQTPNPAIVAANDYALLTELSQGIGTPLTAPAAPKVGAADRINKGPHTTNKTQPHLTGSYTAGTTMQIIDKSTGTILGSAVVNTAGQYSIVPTAPLSLGTHTIYAQAVDVNGGHSFPSPTVTLTILAKATPAGPRGLR